MTNPQTGRKSGVFLTVHLHQKLVERLLLFRIRETRHVGGALLPHSIDLIYVDNAGRSRTSLFEQTPDSCSAKTCTQSQPESLQKHLKKNQKQVQLYKKQLHFTPAVDVSVSLRLSFLKVLSVWFAQAL